MRVVVPYTCAVVWTSARVLVLIRVLFYLRAWSCAFVWLLARVLLGCTMCYTVALPWLCLALCAMWCAVSLYWRTWLLACGDLTLHFLERLSFGEETCLSL